jgi:hypothetical protein
MPNFNLRERNRALEVKARKIRGRRLANDAERAIELVRASELDKQLGVVFLVFDAAEGDIHGYVTVDPILAAMALVSYLEQRYPRANRRTRTSSRQPASRKQGRDVPPSTVSKAAKRGR